MKTPNYETLIDAETWAFIAETDRHYPPDTGTQPIATQRAVYDRMAAAFHRPYPPGISARDDSWDGVPVRLYGPARQAPTILYFHGGGFVVGGLESHDDVCAELCDQTGCAVVSVDYRLAPEHCHPAMYQDALAAARQLLARGTGPVILCGDSAGGNLAATLAHTLRAEPRILGQVLIYPGLGGDVDKGSYLEHAEAPMLRRDDITFLTGIRLSGDAPVADPTYAPLQDRDFSLLPPTVVFTAECDPLSDDGRDYRDAILGAGGRAHWVCEPGLVHGYLRARHVAGRARDSFARIVAALRSMADGKWPYTG